MMDGMRVKGAISNLRSASNGTLFLPLFGLAATRIWFQACLYGGYTQSDNGLSTLLCDFPYGLMLLVVAIVAFMRPPSPHAESVFDVVGSVCMCLAAALLLACAMAVCPVPAAAVSVFSGIAATVAWLVWMPLFARVDFDAAVLYLFGSVAIGSVGGLVLGLFAPEVRLLVAVMMPLVALICQRHASRAVGAVIDEGGLRRPVPVYDGEPVSTLLKITMGVAAFGLALGVTRGYPIGDPVPFDFAERAMHQLGSAALCLFVIWWVVVARKRLSFSALWRTLVLIMGSCALLLTLVPEGFRGMAIALSNIADTMMIGVLLITLQDASRHSSIHPFALFGFVWATRILMRAVGRGLMVFTGLTGQGHAAPVGVVAFCLCLCAVFVLADDIPRKRPFFSGNAVCLRGAGAGHGDDSPIGGRSGRGSGEDAELPQDVGAQALKERYKLTAREMEVVELMAQGWSKRNIGEQLFISENTVRAHVKRIYVKMGIHNKQELLDLYHDAS